LEYAKFLREEEKSHRDYLEGLYRMTIIVLGAAVSIGTAGITFLHFRTRKQVRDEVDAQLQTTVKEELESRMKEARKQVDGLETLTKQLEDKVEKLTGRVNSTMEGIFGKYGEPGEGVPQLELDEWEKKILKSIGESKYSFRTLIGITNDAMQEGVGQEKVNRYIESLTEKGLIGKTLGRTGGERWFVTELGRRHLMSL
jgi:hypothetical protein